MHWFDWLSLGMLLALALRGYSRGLILQLAAFVAVALGLLGGLYLHSAAAAMMPDLGHPVLRLVAGFTVVFIAVALSVNLLARVLKTAVDALVLGPIDRILGAVMGALVGVQVLMLILLLVGRYLPGGLDWLEGTRTAPFLSGLVERLLPLLPDHFLEFFETHADDPERLFRRFDDLRRQGGELLEAAESLEKI